MKPKRLTLKPEHIIEWYDRENGWREVYPDNEKEAQAALEALRSLNDFRGAFGWARCKVRYPSVDATAWEVPEWAE